MPTGQLEPRLNSIEDKIKLFATIVHSLVYACANIQFYRKIVPPTPKHLEQPKKDTMFDATLSYWEVLTVAGSYSYDLIILNYRPSFTKAKQSQYNFPGKTSHWDISYKPLNPLNDEKNIYQLPRVIVKSRDFGKILSYSDKCYGNNNN